MATDPDLFRAALEYVGTITPLQDLFERPMIASRVRRAMDAMGDSGSMPMPGPDRTQLVALMQLLPRGSERDARPAFRHDRVVVADPASLDNLIDIVTPPPVPAWPPAPGWYVVAAVAALLFGWSLWRAAVRWRRAAYRRAALAELERLR